MSSTLFSTTCYIKTEPYNLRICIDNDSKEFSISTIDDILLSIDTGELTSNTTNILSSIRLHFESLIDKKKNSIDNNDDTIPEIIILTKLLNIKQTKKLLDKSNSSSSSISQQLLESISPEQISENYELPLSKSTQIDLSYVDISELFIWRVKRIQLEMDSTLAREFCLILTRYLSKLKHRPRHLLVFVNSQCGKGKGRHVYEEEIVPLFEEANISVNTIYTERANHARDYISEQSLDNYDGLISVGGDGMFSEVCHSLLLKTVQQAGININDSNIDLIRPNLRIGVIPTGSTDAVAFGTTGHNDPITNALQIIVGESLLIDIATIHSEYGFVHFMATMVAYGFFGNIIRQSDQWRFFGPLRYILAGFFQFIRNTSYHAQLTITQAPKRDNSNGIVDDCDRHSSSNSIKRREIFSKNSEANERINFGKSSLTSQIKREGRYRTINCLNMPCRCDNSKYGMSPSVHLADGSFDLILVKRSWYLDFFRFLHQVAEDGRTIEELSNVERFRATEVIIHPIISQRQERGNWACDGELFTANEVRIRAHHQVLNLFASGIRLDQIKKINEENSKTINVSIIEGFNWNRYIVALSFLLIFLFFFYYYFFLL